MINVVVIFIILVFYDFQKFIRKKEPVRVFVLYSFFMAASLIVSLLLAAGKRPSSPSQWIEAALRRFGVLK